MPDPKRDRLRLRRSLRRALAGANAGAIPEGTGTRTASGRDRRYRRFVATGDGLVALGALAVAAGLGGGGLELAALVAVPFVIALGKAAGLYDRDQYLLRKVTLDEAPAVLNVVTLYALAAWLAGELLVEGGLGKPQIAALWVLAILWTLVARVLARRLARRLTTPERCLLIGDEPTAAWLRSKFASNDALHAILVGRVPFDTALFGDEEDGEVSSLDQHILEGSGHGVLGSLDELGVVLGTNDVDRVIVAPENAEPEVIMGTIRLVKALGMKVTLVPSLFEVVGSSVEFDDVDGRHLLALRGTRLTRSSRIVKRGFDVVAATTAAVVLAPVWLGAALAVAVSSRGGILFRQQRIGRDGKEFSMYKFRTMHEGAAERQHELHHLNEAEGIFKLSDDPRVTTRIGRFLRRTALDELPQLVNVLRGEMSVVGPRPLPVHEDGLIEGWERSRLNVPPGMTGLWQIFGSARIPTREMVKIDYLYAAHWSLWLDVKILLRTIPYVLGRRGL